ncbi:unnamed protein product [Camellia sinensis]
MLSRQKIEKSNLEKVISGRLFSPFSSSSPSPQTDSSNSATKSEPAPDEPIGGFDPESLERGAKALQQINTGINNGKCTDHESQRRHNAELGRMQEEYSIRKEQATRATEDQIQAQQCQTEKERAKMEHETIRVKAIAEAEGRAHEAKLTEDHNRRMLIERISGEREKWLVAINTTFTHIEGGFRVLLTARSKLIMTVGGATTLAAGVYTTSMKQVECVMGSPYPNPRQHRRNSFPSLFSIQEGLKSILHGIFKIIELQVLVLDTGTWIKGLDYAMITGGNVARLGSQAVTKIHEIFDQAKKSKKGLLLFIDEADAFFCHGPVKRCSFVLATNRPGDLDSAITDRIDEVINDSDSKWGSLFKRSSQTKTIKDLSEDAIREAARKTEGFSECSSSRVWVTGLLTAIRGGC